jgi:hypothetical protein
MTASKSAAAAKKPTRVVRKRGCETDSRTISVIG